jgi:hypothetical protein
VDELDDDEVVRLDWCCEGTRWESAAPVGAGGSCALRSAIVTAPRRGGVPGFDGELLLSVSVSVSESVGGAMLDRTECIGETACGDGGVVLARCCLGGVARGAGAVVWVDRGAGSAMVTSIGIGGAG